MSENAAHYLSKKENVKKTFRLGIERGNSNYVSNPMLLLLFFLLGGGQGRGVIPRVQNKRDQERRLNTVPIDIDPGDCSDKGHENGKDRDTLLSLYQWITRIL